MSDQSATSSDAKPTTDFEWWNQPGAPGMDEITVDPDEVIDGEIVDDETAPTPVAEGTKSSRLKSAGLAEESRRKDGGTGAPSSGPPKVDEWLDFFSRIVLRAGSDWYIDHAFRGIDENVLSEREVKRIQLKEVERDRIARPFAELANKTKFTRKHGRSIIATSESIESIIALGMWVSRVNRIRAKYAPAGAAKPARKETPRNERTRQSEPSATANGHAGGGPGPVGYYSAGTG